MIHTANSCKSFILCAFCSGWQDLIWKQSISHTMRIHMAFLLCRLWYLTRSCSERTHSHIFNIYRVFSHCLESPDLEDISKYKLFFSYCHLCRLWPRPWELDTGGSSPHFSWSLGTKNPKEAIILHLNFLILSHLSWVQQSIMYLCEIHSHIPWGHWPLQRQDSRVLVFILSLSWVHYSRVLLTGVQSHSSSCPGRSELYHSLLGWANCKIEIGCVFQPVGFKKII